MSYRGLVLPYIERSRRGVSHLHNVGQRHKIPQHRRKFQPRLKQRLLRVVDFGWLGKNWLRPRKGESFTGTRCRCRGFRLDITRKATFMPVAFRSTAEHWEVENLIGRVYLEGLCLFDRMKPGSNNR